MCDFFFSVVDWVSLYVGFSYKVVIESKVKGEWESCFL